MIIYSERRWKKWCMILQDVTRKFTRRVNDIVYTIPRNVVLACVSYVQTSIDLTSWFDDETCVQRLFFEGGGKARRKITIFAAYGGKQRHTCVVPTGTTAIWIRRARHTMACIPTFTFYTKVITLRCAQPRGNPTNPITTTGLGGAQPAQPARGYIISTPDLSHISAGSALWCRTARSAARSR